MVIILRGLRAAATTSDRFLGLLAIGVVSMLLFHVFVNVGMTIGVMPVTGIPLPFLTAGGTSLLANALGIGLLLHVHLHRHDF